MSITNKEKKQNLIKKYFTVHAFSNFNSDILLGLVGSQPI